MNQNNNNSSSLLIRKRKRNVSTTTKVHFCTKPNEIIDTYSALEYDRSGLYDQYNNELPFNQDNNKNNIIFTLSINFIPTATTTTTATTTLTNNTKSLQNKKKPKLSIDTSNIHGPLYFTNMSTNHQKKDQASKLYHEDDTITLQNTEFNRRSLVLVA